MPETPTAATPLLKVRNLELTLADRGGENTVLRGVDFELHAGEMLGLVGSSGAGKSLTTLCLLGLLPRGARSSGEIELAGDGRLGTREAPWSQVRGRAVAIVMQDPAAAFDPLLRVGALFGESGRAQGMSAPVLRRRGLELLERMALPDPERLWRSYSHELSGGQRQRVLIALALMHEPRVLIADEPTTALDVTVQAQIFALLRELVRASGLAVLLVTHDLALVAENCGRMVVIDQGRTVEQGRVADIFRAPGHPATRRLLAAAGVVSSDGEAAS